jgi:TRAP-type C4-dicarboxylate transport system permease large subunit
MLLVLGIALDLAPLVLICTPILLPVVKSFGIDPVHFGIVMLNLGIGLLTPPMGTTLFVGCRIGKVSVDEAMRRYLAVLLCDVYGTDDRNLRALAAAGAAEDVRILADAAFRPRR